MKILFFLLGSFEERILKWGVRNFNLILEHDIIFWGPVGVEVINFNNKRFEVINFPSGCILSSSELIDRLPKGWQPDVVICDTTSICYIQDIYNIPYPTLLLGRDGWGDLSHNLKIVDFFDGISYSFVDIYNINFDFCKKLKILGFPVSVPENFCSFDIQTRPIDILSIATYGNTVYHDRFELLYLIAKSARLSSYTIEYYNNLTRDEIHPKYRQSKIIIDWSHTLSNRSYEAAFNGCLIFSHDSNQLMKDFWVPFQEYIPFNSSNIEELLDYYLSNLDEAQKIANNMQSKFKNEIPNSWGETIEYQINELLATKPDISMRIKRCNHMAEFQKTHNSITPFYYFYHHANTDLFPAFTIEYHTRLNNFLSKSDKLVSSESIEMILEAIKFSFINKDYNKLLYYIEIILKIVPYCPWAFLYRAKYEVINQKKHEAYLTLNLIKLNSIQHSAFFEKYRVFLVERRNIIDSRMLLETIWFKKGVSPVNYQQKYFEAEYYNLMGQLNLDLNNVGLAENNFFQAFKLVPISNSFIKLAQLYRSISDYAKLKEITVLAIENNSYDTLVYYYQSIALTNTDRYSSVRKILKLHLNTLSKFIDNPKLKMEYYFTLSLILFTYINFIPFNLFDRLLTKYINKK